MSMRFLSVSYVLPTHSFLKIPYNNWGEVMASALWLKTMVNCLIVGLQEAKMLVYKECLIYSYRE